MSYTTADEKRETARDSVKTAIQAIHEIVILKCYGHDEYTKEYQNVLYDSYLKLIEVSRQL